MEMAVLMMRTVTLDVGGMVTPLSGITVEKQLRGLPGIHRADVDYATSSATIEYDENMIDLDSIMTWIRKCGYHCDNAQIPTLLCPAPTQLEDK
jgi:copper chaperone CopZ